MKKKSKPLDLSQSKPMEAKSSSRSNIAITVVNTSGNGKRIKLSRGIMDKFDNPSEVQFRILEDKIIIGSYLSSDDKYYKLSQTSGGTLYNASIVENFTEVLNLDFSAVTSITLSNIRFKKAETEEGEVVLVAIVMSNL